MFTMLMFNSSSPYDMLFIIIAVIADLLAVLGIFFIYFYAKWIIVHKKELDEYNKYKADMQSQIVDSGAFNPHKNQQ